MAHIFEIQKPTCSAKLKIGKLGLFFEKNKNFVVRFYGQKRFHGHSKIGTTVTASRERGEFSYTELADP